MQFQNEIVSNKLWASGPPAGGFFNFPGFSENADLKSEGQTDFGVQRSAQPICTGTSVVGLKFDKGVIIAADKLVSYGSLARFQDIDRVFAMNEKIIVGCGGDYADFQSIKRFLDEKIMTDICYNDNIHMKPKSMYNFLTRVMYNRRSRFNPLWVDMIVGGMEDGTPFLGHVDLRGRAYQDSVVSTGFGKHLVLPLVREYMENRVSITEDEAIKLVKKCMEVLHYRDCRASPKYTLAVCTSEKSEVLGPFTVGQNWQLATGVEGY
uniref:Proteasome subunit beta n=1 Tax=Tabanus bromius TaxID=304241 RepID=A0A0K8TS01_TABBR